MNVFFMKFNPHFAFNFGKFCDSQNLLKPAEIWEKSILFLWHLILTRHLWVGCGVVYLVHVVLTWRKFTVSIMGVVYIAKVH